MYEERSHIVSGPNMRISFGGWTKGFFAGLRAHPMLQPISRDPTSRNTVHLLPVGLEKFIDVGGSRFNRRI